MTQETAGNKRRERISFILTLVITILLALFLRLFVFSTIRVEGPSMQDTLFTGENILIEKVSYRFSEPERFDIVVCRFRNGGGTGNANDNYVKRVIGLPGETVSIRDGLIHINGQQLQGDIYGKTLSPHEDMEQGVTVPEGEYFVMGDNRSNSLDSVRLGTIREEDILGRGVLIIWPFNKIGWITK